MKIQTYTEAKFALLNYLGLGNNMNQMIIILGNGCNGKSYLLKDTYVNNRINALNYKIFKDNDCMDIGLKLNEIIKSNDHKYIICIKSLSQIKTFLIEFHDFFLIDMNELYCGLPKTCFGTKYVEAFNTNVIDYSINGKNVQEYLNNKFNNDDN